MGTFETLQVIDDQGDLVGEDPGLDPEIYQVMYRNMVLARTLDRRMLALQRQGRIGTYAMLEGQEAVQVGSALALEPHDFVFPSYREHGVQVTRGLPMEVLLAYWKGLPNAAWDIEKYRTGIVTVPIASQVPHAVGYSYMTKLRGEDVVTVAYFGDGATSEGDFHAGLNFAGAGRHRPCSSAPTTSTRSRSPTRSRPPRRRSPRRRRHMGSKGSESTGWTR
jgi:pyruvate dehydrogenase E1 component alpha subunit